MAESQKGTIESAVDKTKEVLQSAAEATRAAFFGEPTTKDSRDVASSDTLYPEKFPNDRADERVTIDQAGEKCNAYGERID